MQELRDGTRGINEVTKWYGWAVDNTETDKFKKFKFIENQIKSIPPSQKKKILKNLKKHKDKLVNKSCSEVFSSIADGWSING